MTRIALFVWLILTFGQTPFLNADDLFWRTAEAENACCPRLRAGDEIWIVSSRCLAKCEPIDLEKLRGFAWTAGEWPRADWHQLVTDHRASDSKRTVVFLHGNRTDIHWSARRGLQVFDLVFGADLNRSDVRFVIWSWPTDPKHHRMREYRENSERSVWEGQILAEFLKRLGTKSSIGIIGYSFGAQAVVSASEIACCEPFAENETGHQFGIVLLAPALQKPWIDVESPLAASAECVSSSIELVNSRDRALKVHRCLTKFSTGSFAWTTGVDEFAPSSEGFPEWDIGALVGGRHDVVRYVSHPDVAWQIRSTTLFEIAADTNDAPIEK